MALVDPAVSRAKLERELALWREQEQEYRAKGWLLLRADLDELVVDVAFVAVVPLGTLVPAVLPAVQFRYDDYDILPPSLRFIDVFSGRPMRAPVRQALHNDNPSEPTRNILMTNRRGQDFLCIRGTREYHEHSDHNGDLWLLYRRDGLSSLSVLCDRVASSMTSTVAGVQFQMQPALALAPAGMPLELAAQHQRGLLAAWNSQLEEQAPAGEA